MSSIDEQLAKVKAHMAIIETEHASLKAGRKASAPRLRKALLGMKKDAHTMRASATEYLKSLVVERRVEAPAPPPVAQPVAPVKKRVTRPRGVLV